MPTFYEHPHYRVQKENWRKWRTLYKGDERELKGPQFLFPHALEAKTADPASEQLRKGREQRTSYLAIPEILVSLWLSYFFAKPPTLEAGDGSTIKQASKNIDGERRSLNRFLRDRVTATYLIYGKVAILADSFGEEVQSLAEQKEKGIRPFLEIIEPLDLVDWSIEQSDPKRMGEINAARQVYKLVGTRQSLMEIPRTYLYSVVRSRTPNGYQIEKYRRLIEDASIGLSVDAEINGEDSRFELAEEPRIVAIDEVPISLLEDESWLKDVVGEVLRHYNLRSGLDNVNYYQGYQKIFAKGVTDAAYHKALTEYIVALLPEGGDAFAIDAVDTSALERAVDGALLSCFKIGLNQLRTLPSDSKEAPSAEAAQAERLNTTQLVEATIEDLENAANKALEHFGLLAGEAPGKVYFNREISELGVEQILTIYQSMRQEFGNYPKIPKELVKKLVQKLFPNSEQNAELIAAIDTAPDIRSPQEAQLDRAKLLEGVIGGRRTAAGNQADQGVGNTDQQVR